MFKQGYIWKKLKNVEYFFVIVDLSSPIINFKVNFYKFIKKYPPLKNSMLSAYYFKNYFKMIKLVSKKHENEFSLEDFW